MSRRIQWRRERGRERGREGGRKQTFSHHKTRQTKASCVIIIKFVSFTSSSHYQNKQFFPLYILLIHVSPFKTNVSHKQKDPTSTRHKLSIPRFSLHVNMKRNCFHYSIMIYFFYIQCTATIQYSHDASSVSSVSS